MSIIKTHKLMGRVNIQTPAAAAAAEAPCSSLTHFAHPHELHPLPLYHPHTLCSGCKLKSSEIMYTCPSPACNFTLHQSCAKLPCYITHPSHGGCTLALLTKPSYNGGAFNCDACSLRGDGWSYHCARCDYDLHVTCASKPLKIRHRAHSSCELHLTFKNPYVNEVGFSCDICRRIGAKQWLYRCHSCEFDVHLDCVTAPQPVLPQATPLHHNQLMHSASTGGMNICSQFSGPPLQQPPHLMHSESTGWIGINPSGVNPLQNPINAGPGYRPGMVPMQNNQPPRPMGGGLGNNLMMAAVQGFVEGTFQGVGQGTVQHIVGGDGGDGDGTDGYGGDASMYY